MKIFVTYSRTSQDRVPRLIEDLQELGHEVWYDRHLSGGQSWWDNILQQVRGCDLYVFVLTQDSLDSVACVRELKYAQALKRPLLPVLMEPGVSMAMAPRCLSELQYVDYSVADGRDVILALVKATNDLPPAPPPTSPLPEPPPVPISYLDTLKERVEARTISKDEQIHLVRDLRIRLDDRQVEREDVVTLLERLRRHDDLFASIAAEIDDLLEKSTGPASGNGQQEPPIPSARSERTTRPEEPDRAATTDGSGARDRPPFGPAHTLEGDRPAFASARTVAGSDAALDPSSRQRGEKRWSKGVMICLIVISLLLPVVGLVAGVVGLVGGLRRSQVFTLLGVSGAMIFLALIVASFNSVVYY